MLGWSRDGDAFHQLLKPREGPVSGASAFFAHPLETLERDGLPAATVHRDLLLYAGQAPWVAYELDKHWEVLLADWQQLGIMPPGERGFCAASLAQRLLDPLPAANCRLEMLRQFYQLPERPKKSALGQLETLLDLLEQVLVPLSETRGASNVAATGGLHPGALVSFANHVWKVQGTFVSGRPRGRGAGAMAGVAGCFFK